MTTTFRFTKRRMLQYELDMKTKEILLCCYANRSASAAFVSLAKKRFGSVLYSYFSSTSFRSLVSFVLYFVVRFCKPFLCFFSSPVESSQRNVSFSSVHFREFCVFRVGSFSYFMNTLKTSNRKCACALLTSKITFSAYKCICSYIHTDMLKNTYMYPHIDIHIVRFIIRIPLRPHQCSHIISNERITY